MIPILSVRRKFSFPTLRSSARCEIMANHRPRMQLDLSEHGGAGDYSDSSPVRATQSADSPKPNLTNLLLPLSSRFNVGKGKDAASGSKTSPKKAKDRFRRGAKSTPPVPTALTVTEPVVGLNEVSVEVLKEWEISFNSLLKNPEGVDLFEYFLKSEFSEENIQFWKACEKYKSAPDHLVEKEAAIVYEEFLAPQAPKLVNIDHQTSREIEENMKNPDRATFNRAQQSIYLLMARDSFVRFIKSEQFQQALKR